MNSSLSALLGGALIGLSASIMLLINGKVTGVSGIISASTQPGSSRHYSENALFVAGLVLGGIILQYLFPANFDINVTRSPFVIVLSGLLVGFGTRLGSGCTSGHGICGISRLSLRSVVATCTFMAAGVLSVYFFSGAQS